MSGDPAGGEWRLVPNWVGEALAFHADGRPLGRVAAGGRPQVRVDAMDPSVVAFQGMIQDGLGTRGRPVSAVYGERVLSLVPGRLVHVATLCRGRPDRALRASMVEAVRGIEARWGAAVEAWSGAASELEGLPAELVPVVDRTADRGPGEVADPLNARGVFPVSAVDFEGGRARLKVAVFSSGLMDVRGGFMELTFDRNALRLEASRPDHALTDEGRVRLGTIATGEASTVACLLEPLGPGRHLVEIILTFFDEANNPRHLEVPNREFQVLFPSLAMGAPPGATPPPAREGLDGALRAWTYPASLGGLDVMRVARTVLGTRGLVLSAGEEEAGPPPAWSVEGRAFAGRTPLEVGVRVRGGEARRLELSVASADPATTAGALAEMRKLMEEAFFRRWRGQVVLEEDAPRRPRAEVVPGTDIDICITIR